MKRRPKRQGLFVGFWFELDGRRIRKVRRPELAEAYRLISKHSDIRRGALSEGGSMQPSGFVDHGPPSLSARPVFSDEVDL
jgi:hypothetical protein